MAVCRALDGEGPPPFALWLGRLCEAFHCLPTEAYEEWQRLPAGLLEEILEARSFEAAKAVVDRATDAKALPDHPMIGIVKAVEQAVALDDIERAQQDNDGSADDD